MSDTKHCNLCGTTKPLTEFYTKPNGKPRAGCKACLCAASRKRDPIYQKTHRARCNAKVRHWRKRNLEHARKLSCAAVKRYRRRKRDRGQTFLALATAPA
jgi:recombinational DNA repair protein (RecF pathway)